MKLLNPQNRWIQKERYWSIKLYLIMVLSLLENNIILKNNYIEFLVFLLYHMGII